MASAISSASVMPTPDPGLKNASALSGENSDSSTTMFDLSNVKADAFSSVLRSPTMSAVRAGSVIDGK